MNINDIVTAEVNGNRAVVTGDVPNPTRLLERVGDLMERYVVLPDHNARTALSLFVLHTWAIDGAHATPYLVVVSPERRTGKSLLLEVLRLLVRAPWHTVSTTEAALFRKIERDTPTLLLDEIDAIFGSNRETEPLRAALNAGNRRGATATRVVKEGANLEAREFSVFCPKVLAGIDTGSLPNTIRDRAIVVHMKRRHGGEPIERFRARDASREVQPIVEALQEFAEVNVEQLYEARPDLPDALNDRAQDAWEPLLAIADLAGGDWPSRARAAAVELNGDSEADEESRGVHLLGATRQAMGTREVIATAELLEAINGDEELPFGAWREGQGIDARGLARLLKPYGVKPTSVRVDDDHTPKGYRAGDFYDSWARYLSPQEPQPAQQAQQADETSAGWIGGVADVADVAGLESTDADAELERLTSKGLA